MLPMEILGTVSIIIIIGIVIQKATGSTPTTDGVICAAWKTKMKQYNDCLGWNSAGACEALKPLDYPNPPSKACGCDGAK